MFSIDNADRAVLGTNVIHNREVTSVTVGISTAVFLVWVTEALCHTINCS